MVPDTIDDFDTRDLLEAVDELDKIRGMLADAPNLEPPQIRIDLMKLHTLAMRVCNKGSSETSELMEQAIDIEDQVEEMRDATDRILTVT